MPFPPQTTLRFIDGQWGQHNVVRRGLAVSDYMVIDCSGTRLAHGQYPWSARLLCEPSRSSRRPHDRRRQPAKPRQPGRLNLIPNYPTMCGYGCWQCTREYALVTHPARKFALKVTQHIDGVKLVRGMANKSRGCDVATRNADTPLIHKAHTPDNMGRMADWGGSNHQKP